jgi:predicted CXXCH cytochrome family protein
VAVVAVGAWAGATLIGRARASRPAGATVTRAGSAKFVGTQACRSCHTEEFQRWTGSQHDRAMQHAREGAVLGDFRDVRFTEGRITSTFFRRGGKYIVRTDAADGTLRDFEIKYTFGVEPLQQYLVEMPDGRVQALPVAWDSRPREAGGQRWFHLYPGQGIEHGDDLHWTGRMQNWNFMCADCHSTDVRRGYDAQKDQFRTTWSEISVGCEACHGPGSRHVDWAKRPRALRRMFWRDDGMTVRLTERAGVRWAVDPATGHPVRSVPRTTDREVQLCAQCHARRAQIAEGYVAAGARFDDHYVADLIMPGLYHADGQQKDEVYTYGSFLQSRMYHAGVTCSDCHDPHTQKLRAPGNQVCTQCHTAARYDAPAHDFHPARGDGARCVSCHMPATTYMAVDPRRDHSIRVPRPDQTVRLGVPNACNGCHADRTADWAAGQVRSWYGHDPSGFQRFAEAFHADERDAPDAATALAGVSGDPAQPAIVRASALARLANRPGALALDVARAARSDPDPAVRRAALLVLEQLPPRERVAVAGPLLGDSSRTVRLQAAWLLAPASGELGGGERVAFARAADEFIAAERHNADRPEGRLALGTFLAQLGRGSDAAAEYRAAMRLAPTLPAPYVNLADLARAAGQEADAERTLREGLAALPNDADLHHALGLSLARSGRVSDAVAELQRAASLRPDRPELAYAYAVALHSAGRVQEAMRTLEAARARHPTNADLLFALATFHRDAGETDAAIRDAELLTRITQGDPQAEALLESLRRRPPP